MALLGANEAGRVTFLKSYAYRFFRFRAEAYWYGLVHMIHSLLLSLAPVIPSPMGQLIATELIVIALLILTIVVMPL